MSSKNKKLKYSLPKINYETILIIINQHMKIPMFCNL